MMVLGLVFLLLALFAPVAEAAVAVNAASSIIGSGPTVTLNHNIAGTNTLIVVDVTIGNLSTTVVNSITHGGQALTPLPVCKVAPSPNFGQTERWYKLSPASGTNQTLVTLNENSYLTQVRVTSFTGVLQSMTAADFACITAIGTSTTPTITIGSAAGEIVYDALSVTSGTTTRAVVGAGQTEQANLLSPGDFNSAGSTGSGAVSTTMTWTLDASKVWALAAIRIRSDGTADTTPPTAPTGLSCTAASSSKLSCNFIAATDNVGVTGYNVERSTTGCGGTFSPLTSVTVTTFMDSGLSADTSYCYRVNAADSAGNIGAFSTSVSATTMPNRTVRIAYTDNSTDETGFICKRCEGANCNPSLDALFVGANVTQIDDTQSPQPIAGYTCRAVKTGASDSANSNVWYTPASTPAILAVSPTTLAFAGTIGGANPVAQTLTVQNLATGGAQMAWTLSDDAAWLACVPANGTNTVVLSCTVNLASAGSVSGTLSATITVSAPGATNDPTTVPVTLSLSPGGTPASGWGGRVR